MTDSAWTILSVGVAPDARATVEQAARLAWTVTTLDAASLQEALAHDERAGCELLLLGAGVSPAERERARQALTRDGLPRWPVVVLDRGADGEHLSFIDTSAARTDDLAARLKAIARQHETAQAAARAHGDLCTIARRIGHELRSPLGCIITSAEVLREEFSGTPETIDALVQPILDSAGEMTRLIQRLTLIARATAMPAPTGRVDVGLAVWKTRERLAAPLTAANAEVTEPPTWPEATGVSEWIEQIWESLIENALAHAGPDPRIELGWDQLGAEVRFFVRDHGPGIPADERERLFRPFHQLHRIDSGRGIGLALVRRLVELQGGRCGFEPVAPHGACFDFTLRASHP